MTDNKNKPCSIVRVKLFNELNRKAGIYKEQKKNIIEQKALIAYLRDEVKALRQANEDSAVRVAEETRLQQAEYFKFLDLDRKMNAMGDHMIPDDGANTSYRVKLQKSTKDQLIDIICEFKEMLGEQYMP